MMMAGHFSKSHVSSGDLNRGSQDGVVSPHMVALLTSVRNSPCFGGLRRTKTCHWQLFARPSMLFGYFLHDAKSDKPCSPSQGDSRFCKPRISPLKRQLHTNPIKSFCRFAAVSLPGRHTPCAFFAAPRPLFRRLCRLSVACSNESPPAVCRRRFVSPCGGVFAGTANNLCFC